MTDLKRALGEVVKGATLRWPGGQGAAIVTDGHTGLNTFFNAHPAAARVIIVLPVGPHSWYLAMNPKFTAQSVADYRQFLTIFAERANRLGHQILMLHIGDRHIDPHHATDLACITAGGIDDVFR